MFFYTGKIAKPTSGGYNPALTCNKVGNTLLLLYRKVFCTCLTRLFFFEFIQGEPEDNSSVTR